MKKSRSVGRAEVAGWALLAMLIGYLDYVTGPFVSMTLFYLAPVVGAAWFAGRSAGVLVALVAGLASLVSDQLLASPSTSATLYWNTASRTVVLVIAAVVVNRVHADRLALEAVNTQRTRSLQLLDRGLAVPAKELVELVDHWDGSLEQLRAVLRPRAETIGFLARDFTEMILLQRGRLALSPRKIDLLELVEGVRAEEQIRRRVTLVAPSEGVLVLADAARVRQSITSLLELVGRADEVFLSLTRQEQSAELVISAESATGTTQPDAQTLDEVSLSVDLARLIFESQGGSLNVLRNPITRSLRATARLPLA